MFTRLKKFFFGCVALVFCMEAFALERLAEGENNGWLTKYESDTVIVFVHGIFSDSRSAWSAGNSDDSPYWPQLVSEDEVFRKPGIYMGGFYTSPNSSFFDIQEASSQLYNQLVTGSKRVIDKRKIVFVTHSTGGIVVRQLLVNHPDQFLGKKVGLVLIASPSLGSKTASRLRALANWFKNKMARQLQWNSEYLVQLDEAFKMLINEQKIPGLIGIEAIENHSIVPGGEPLVDGVSGARYFGKLTILGGKDHFEAVKPTHVEDEPHKFLRYFFQERFLKEPLPELPLENQKWRTLRIQPYSFHGNYPRNSWGLLEVRIFDPNGKQIMVEKVETSSCVLECNEKTNARRENLIDGFTALQTNDPNVFWAPTEKNWDDAKQWVKFHFDESRVGLIEIHQWFKDGCMRECRQEKIYSREAKIRANAKSLLVSLANKNQRRDAAYWLTLNDDRIVSVEIPYP